MSRPANSIDPAAIQSLADAVAGEDRAALGRAITVIESRRPEDEDAARRLIQILLPRTGGAMRVGVSGVPGVGKSTFIETLGGRLTAGGQTVAVLAVDPSSQISGGSILGDKTRMAALAADPRAFIRPSPAGGAWGGVGHKSRETLLLLEAAGYQVVLVETVGVGQAETRVAAMVDSFLLLMLPGAGDELQGIKRGIMELADVIAVNKADGAGAGPAERARGELSRALQLLQPRHEGWQVPVLTASGLSGEGVDEVWQALLAHRRLLEGSGQLEAQRRDQAQAWLWELVDQGLRSALAADGRVEAAVRAGTLSPAEGAAALLAGLGLSSTPRGWEADPG